MSYPAAALQKAMFDAFTGSGALATAMGGTVRAFDRVDPAYQYPYITFADLEVGDNGNTCEADMYEAFATVHVWSSAVGQVEVKNISEAVREIMTVPFAVFGWMITAAEFSNARHFADVDRLKSHSVLTFRFLLEPS